MLLSLMVLSHSGVCLVDLAHWIEHNDPPSHDRHQDPVVDALQAPETAHAYETDCCARLQTSEAAVQSRATTRIQIDLDAPNDSDRGEYQTHSYPCRGRSPPA